MVAVVLVDAENTSYNSIISIMNAINEDYEGNDLNIKRVYGDFMKSELVNWRKPAVDVGLKLVQQCSYVAKKGTSDQQLTIDAMKLLYTNNVDVFYIITSDSDFLPLCLELKEHGKRIVGIGKKQTPISFVKMCHKFLFLETIENLNEQTSLSTRKIIYDIILKLKNENDCINIGFLKEQLVKQGLSKNLKIKKVLSDFSEVFGMFQQNSTVYAYIR